MIDDYFQSITAVLAASPIVKSHSVAFDKRSPTAGYIRGDVYFLDDSLLHFREFVNTQFGVERFTYAYHFQRADGALVFRYDNTTHFPGLPNFPHHKHVGDESNVTSATPPDLATVLKEIEPLIAVG